MAMTQAQYEKVMAENAALKAANDATIKENAELKATNEALSSGVKPFVVKINPESGTIGVGGAGLTTKWFHPLEAAKLIANDRKLGNEMLDGIAAILIAHPPTEKWVVGTETLCWKPAEKKAFNLSPEGIEKAANKKWNKRGEKQEQIYIND